MKYAIIGAGLLGSKANPLRHVVCYKPNVAISKYDQTSYTEPLHYANVHICGTPQELVHIAAKQHDATTSVDYLLTINETNCNYAEVDTSKLISYKRYPKLCTIKPNKVKTKHKSHVRPYKFHR
jgi:hypothetical protein